MSIKEGKTEMETDVALIMDIKAGNKKALGKLVERHKKLAYRLALGLVGNKPVTHSFAVGSFSWAVR